MTYWNEPEPLAKIIKYSYDSILNLPEFNGWNVLNDWNQRLLGRLTMAPEFASVSCSLSIAVYCPGNCRSAPICPVG